MIVALELTAPIAAFNGGIFRIQIFSLIEQNVPLSAIAKRVIETISSCLMSGFIGQ